MGRRFSIAAIAAAILACAACGSVKLGADAQPSSPTSHVAVVPGAPSAPKAKVTVAHHVPAAVVALQKQSLACGLTVGEAAAYLSMSQVAVGPQVYDGLPACSYLQVTDPTDVGVNIQVFHNFAALQPTLDPGSQHYVSLSSSPLFEPDKAFEFYNSNMGAVVYVKFAGNPHWLFVRAFNSTINADQVKKAAMNVATLVMNRWPTQVPSPPSTSPSTHGKGVPGIHGGTGNNPPSSLAVCNLLSAPSRNNLMNPADGPANYWYGWNKVTSMGSNYMCQWNHGGFPSGYSIPQNGGGVIVTCGVVAQAYAGAYKSGGGDPFYKVGWVGKYYLMVGGFNTSDLGNAFSQAAAAVKNAALC